MVLNRCRKPANADILVPGDTVCVIGTTSTRVPYEECDTISVTPDEVHLLVTEGAKLAPCLEHTRILRAYAGVRPLVSADNDPSGRNISRGRDVKLRVDKNSIVRDFSQDTPQA